MAKGKIKRGGTLGPERIPPGARETACNCLVSILNYDEPGCQDRANRVDMIDSHPTPML